MRPRLPISLLPHYPERFEAVKDGSTEVTKHGSSEATFPAMNSRGNGRDACAQQGWSGNVPGASMPNTQHNPGAGARPHAVPPLRPGDAVLITSCSDRPEWLT